jgi:His-Xaa-Ser system radical SAM maturase HxsC
MKNSNISKIFYSGVANFSGNKTLLVVKNQSGFESFDKNDIMLLLDHDNLSQAKNFENKLIIGKSLQNTQLSGNIVNINDNSLILEEGDILHVSSVSERAKIVLSYRIKSSDNFLFPTNRCNNRCIMCPQSQFHGDFDVHDIKKIIRLIDKSTMFLGFSGGEPTLLKENLVEIFSFCFRQLPNTHLSLLTNGRMLSYISFVDHINSVSNNQLSFCIPIHSHDFKKHDYITQTPNSFKQTVQGITNLLDKNNTVELRVVIQNENYKDLPHIAKYIVDNFYGVTRVAFLGLEATGYALKNIDKVWVSTKNVRPFLDEAIIMLLKSKIDVALFNYPLCKIGKPFRLLCSDSISDYKVRYFEKCDICKLKKQCGGIFSSSLKLLESEGVFPIDE